MIDERSGDTRHEVVAYKRGLSLRETLRGAVSRFLPASIGSLAVGGALLDSSGPNWWIEFVVGITGFAGFLTLGFGLGLLVLQRRLFPDAGVDGRRSVLAGLLSPLAMAIGGSLFITTGLGMAEAAGLLVLVGVVLAVVFFFPWLTPTPESMRGAKYSFDPVDDAYDLGPLLEE